MTLLVWDFDGTLADSHPLIVAGMEHALAGLGLQDHPGLREEWLKYVGLPVEDGLRNTFEPLGLDPAEVLRVYRTFDWMANEHLLLPFPGMSDLVQELHAMGVPMAIASSKRTVPLRRQVETFGWGDCFQLLVTPDDVEPGRGKPEADSLHLVLAHFGCSPEQALMIGDTPFDLDMAQRAGVPSVAVGHGFYGQEALVAWNPVAYAPDTAALRDILLAKVAR